MSAEWTMVGITLIYVIATCFICWANIKTANASKAQLQEMQKQYADENRPKITVEVIYLKRSIVGFRFRNAGKLIANCVHICFDQQFCDSLNETFKKEIHKLNSRECIIGAGQYYDFYVGGNSYLHSQNKQPASGKITYCNGTNSYEETFMVDLESYATFYSINSEAEDFFEKIDKQTNAINRISSELAEIRKQISEKGENDA